MKNMSKKKKVLVGFIAALVLIFGLFGLKMFLEQPRNLGDNLEYIGKRHTGCPLPLPLGYILLCSSEPGEEYYFGTDLSVEELRGYFGRADIGKSGSGSSEFSNYILMSFQDHKSMSYFYINYFDNPAAVKQAFDLRTTTKNVVSLSDEDYKEAKQALIKD